MDSSNISTTTIDPIINNFNEARKGVQYIGQPILFGIGFVGCILNILIFQRPSMRSNSCVIYFHASSWTSIFCLTLGIFASFLATVTNNNPTYYNMFYCKFRYFAIHSSQLATRLFIVLASLDRLFLCSNSVRIRQLCRVSVAIKVIPVTILLSACAYIWVLVLYEAQPLKRQCLVDSAQIYDILVYWIITFGVTTILLSICSGLIMLKLRQSANRAGRNQSHIHARDRHLITMLIGQLILYIFSTIPYASKVLYDALTSHITDKSQQRLAIENFFATLFISFGYYIFNGVSFYIYTLTAPSFRRELLELILPRRCYQQQSNEGTQLEYQGNQTSAPHKSDVDYLQLSIPNLPRFKVQNILLDENDQIFLADFGTGQHGTGNSTFIGTKHLIIESTTNDQHLIFFVLGVYCDLILCCIREDPKTRSTAKQVVKDLEKIIDKTIVIVLVEQQEEQKL